jgi:hypothetical protein
MTETIHQEQVQKLLQYIDATQSEAVKSSIFHQLGRECFYTTKQDLWLAQFRGNPQAYFDRVNVQHAAKFWEKLEYSEDGKTLYLTGRVVQKCACAFADCTQPPLALCNFCCKGFQQEFFRTLLGREVEIEITDSYLFGGERCSTAIHFI